MMSWLSSLFGRCPKEELKQLTAYKLAPTKKKYKKLSIEEKRNMVTDYNINKMTYKSISIKYGCSYDTARRIITKAWNIKVK